MGLRYTFNCLNKYSCREEHRLVLFIHDYFLCGADGWMHQCCTQSWHRSRLEGPLWQRKSVCYDCAQLKKLADFRTRSYTAHPPLPPTQYLNSRKHLRHLPRILALCTRTPTHCKTILDNTQDILGIGRMSSNS